MQIEMLQIRTVETGWEMKLYRKREREREKRRRKEKGERQERRKEE